MNKLFLAILPAVLLASAACNPVTKTATVTANPVSGLNTTNFVYSLNKVNLDTDCSGLLLVGTPALTYVLHTYPQTRPIILDIQQALNGAINGADTNVIATIEGFVGKDQSLDDQLTPIIQAASDLRGQLIAKYVTPGAVGSAQLTATITMSVLQTELRVVNLALAAPVTPIALPTQ